MKKAFKVHIVGVNFVSFTAKICIYNITTKVGAVALYRALATLLFFHGAL